MRLRFFKRISDEHLHILANLCWYKNILLGGSEKAILKHIKIVTYTNLYINHISHL